MTAPKRRALSILRTTELLEVDIPSLWRSASA